MRGETGESAAADQPGMADARAALAEMGAAARGLGVALGFSQTTLAAAEAFDSLECQINRSVEEIATLPDGALREAFACFGDDLEIDLGMAGLDPALDPITTGLRAASDGASPDDAWSRALADFRAAAGDVAATQGESVSVDVTLRILKRRALDHAGRMLAARALDAPLEAPLTCVVFYSAEALLRRLTLQAAMLWSARGLGGAERRTLVAICDAAGYLAGVALEVAGAAGPAPVNWLTLSPQAWRRFTQRVARARALRASESAWNGFALPLMPDHLRVADRMPGLEQVAGRLAGLRAGTALCALASAVEGSGSTAILRFAGTRPASMRLDLATPGALLPSGESGPGPDVASNAGNAADTADTADTMEAEQDPLAALATWAYRDASPDRLAIARDALARELPPAERISLERVYIAAGSALDAARANLTIYLRGAAARYFQVRDAAQAAVSAYADATRKAVTDLTSDVVDNLYKTVGLIAGVVIAGLIAPTASRPVAAAAALIYTGYVVFILWYLLRARHARYVLERAALNRALAAMDELTASERATLERPATDASAHFATYYRYTWWTYVALTVAGVAVFLLILTPAWELVAHAAPAAPTPAATRA